jgi:hypothetical protein
MTQEKRALKNKKNKKKRFWKWEKPSWWLPRTQIKKTIVNIQKNKIKELINLEYFMVLSNNDVNKALLIYL